MMETQLNEWMNERYEQFLLPNLPTGTECRHQTMRSTSAHWLTKTKSTKLAEANKLAVVTQRLAPHVVHAHLMVESFVYIRVTHDANIQNTSLFPHYPWASMQQQAQRVYTPCVCIQLGCWIKLRIHAMRGRGAVWTNESWFFCRRWRVILLSWHWLGVCSTTEVPELPRFGLQS